MTTAEATRLIEIVRTRTNETCDELIAELTETPKVIAAGSVQAQPETPVAPVPSDGAWSLPDAAMTGGWEEKRREAGGSYKWPDGTVEPYEEIVRYSGTGDFAGIELALGYDGKGNVAGFVLGRGGGSMRGITYFFAADDYADSNEAISMIRGGGPRGRSGFGPNDPVPPAYSGFTTDTLRNRCAGKWNVLGVVADVSDAATMLRHIALQARMRGLA
jgi:hypothetical protein